MVPILPVPLLPKEEMEAVINGDHGNVFAVLGIHKNKGSKEVFIRTYQPHSKSIELLDSEGKSLGFMTKLDDRGFYQINLGQYLDSLLPKAEIFGVDISAAMLQKTADKNVYKALIQGDILAGVTGDAKR